MSEEKEEWDVDNYDEEEDGKKGSGGIGFYFINFFLLLIILCFLALMSVLFMCHVQDVVVKGSTIYSDAELQQVVMKDPYSSNAIYCVFKNRADPPSGIPFIDRIRVSLRDRNTVLVKVKEKDLFGYIEMDDGKYIYYDSNGEVLEVSERFVDKGLVKVSGLKPKDPEQGKELPVGSTNVKTILLLQSAVIEDDLPVTEIAFSEDGTILLNMGDIMINLGTRSNLEQKMRRLKYIVPKLEGLKGTLHLEEWTEENTDVVFEQVK